MRTIVYLGTFITVLFGGSTGREVAAFLLAIEMFGGKGLEYFIVVVLLVIYFHAITVYGDHKQYMNRRAGYSILLGRDY